MKNTEHFNIPYPEPTDPVSQFPDQVAKPTAELIGTFLYEQEQKQAALDEALAGKAPASHTHSTSQVNGLDTALDGKAPVSHTHSTSQVNGLDAALDGKAPQATLDTRVPAGLALRLDTTVGTRIFAGDTMIYGDTGWRALSTWNQGVTSGFPLTPSWVPGAGSGGIYIRRVGDKVYLRVDNLNRVSIADASVWLSSYRVPQGFLPEVHERVFGLLTASSFAVIQIQTNGQLTRPSGALSGENGLHTVSGSYLTWTTWPTTLPGLPA